MKNLNLLLTICLFLIPIVSATCNATNTNTTNQSSNCSDCNIQGCAQCIQNDPNRCLSCQGNYQLSQNNLVCSVPQCDIGLVFIENSCQCKDGTYFNLDNVNSNISSCFKCIDNCKICSDGQACELCYQGYTQPACDRCPSNCLICSGKNCITCQSGYFLDGANCSALSQGVQGSFFLIQGNETFQVQCIGGCQKCYTPYTCLTCITGYYLNNQSICKKCDASCFECQNSQTNCVACHSGYVLQDNKCIQCQDQNCIQCQPAFNCQNCALGYFSQSGTCNLCGQNCLSCVSLQICQQCSQNYVLINNNCTQCLSGCGICDSTDMSICLGCNDGLYLQNGNCLFCKFGCETCTSQTICTTCISGYSLSSQSCIMACMFPCATCSDDNPQFCNSCFLGYILNGSSCDQDIDGNDYVACPRGYALNLTQNICQQCQTGSNCLKCNINNKAVCTLCSTGYYLQNSDCQPCPSQCTTCNSNLQCTSCAIGYFEQKVLGDSTGRCLACDTQNYFCSSCINSPDQCTSCMNSFNFQGLKCISNVNVDAQIILDGTKQGFTQNVVQLKKDFLSLLGASFQNKTNLLTINQLQDGSVDVNMTIGTTPNVSGNTVYNNLNSLDLDTINYQIGGIRIQSAKFQLDCGTDTTSDGCTGDNDDDQQQQQQQEEVKKKNANLGLILGLSIPLLVILVVGIIIFKSRFKKADNKLDEFTDSEKELPHNQL